MSIQERIRGIVAEIAGRPAKDVEVSEPLFRGGMELSSIQGARILTRIEGELGVSIADEDLDLECVKSIESLARFVETLPAGRGQSGAPAIGGGLLAEVAEATSLREGSSGVANVLRLVYEARNLALKELGRRSGLPVPVCSAIRRELEHKGILLRASGLALTEAGTRFVQDVLGVRTRYKATCPTCQGQRIVIGENLQPVIGQLERHFAQSPGVDVTLDQAPATPLSALRRALFMYRAGAVEGRAILFLGDDDLISVTVALLGRALGRERIARRLLVLEVDDRRVEHLERISKQEDLGIEVRRHDLREPTPEDLLGEFDTFETDPSYTLPGVKLFVSRGLEALSREPGRQGFLSFAARSPDDQLEIHRALVDMGLAVQEVVPGFNDYQGASLLGGTSQLFHLLSSRSARPLIGPGPFQETIYTGQTAPTKRLYVCAGCKLEVEVGMGQRFGTIELLQAGGCPACGNPKFRYLRRVRSGPRPNPT